MGFTLLLLGSSLGLGWPLASEYTRSFAVVLSRYDLPAQLSFWAQPSWSHLCHLQALNVATHWALSSMKLGNSVSGLLLMPGLSPSCYQYLAHYRKVFNLGIPRHMEGLQGQGNSGPLWDTLDLINVGTRSMPN